MTRKAIICGACLMVVAAIALVLVGVFQGGSETTARRSAWTVTYPLPTSNSTAAASQTNLPSQDK